MSPHRAEQAWLVGWKGVSMKTQVSLVAALAIAAGLAGGRASSAPTPLPMAGGRASLARTLEGRLHENAGIPGGGAGDRCGPGRGPSKLGPYTSHDGWGPSKLGSYVGRASP